MAVPLPPSTSSLAITAIEANKVRDGASIEEIEKRIGGITEPRPSDSNNARARERNPAEARALREPPVRVAIAIGDDIRATEARLALREDLESSHADAATRSEKRTARAITAQSPSNPRATASFTSHRDGLNLSLPTRYRSPEIHGSAPPPRSRAMTAEELEAMATGATLLASTSRPPPPDIRPGSSMAICPREAPPSTTA